MRDKPITQWAFKKRPLNGALAKNIALVINILKAKKMTLGPSINRACLAHVFIFEKKRGGELRRSTPTLTRVKALAVLNEIKGILDSNIKGKIVIIKWTMGLVYRGVCKLSSQQDQFSWLE